MVVAAVAGRSRQQHRTHSSSSCPAAQEKLNRLEAELGEHRGAMALGYKDPAGGDFRKVSSVQLSNTMKTAEDEATRKACWEVRTSAATDCAPPPSTGQ